MIYGVVNLRREATLPLVVGNANGQRQVIDTVVDTGFSGFLTLPLSIIASLDLPWSASDIVTLGDGSETLFDLYTATVIWDGQYREIYIAESETEPLLWGCHYFTVIDCRLILLRAAPLRLKNCKSKTEPRHCIISV
jgi:predicted aspartyl protease